MEKIERFASLSDLCDWSEPERVAVEFHDHEKTVCINYAELEAAKNIVHDLLVHVEDFEIIGIDSDVARYCVPSLMLGIASCGHGFLNLPEDAPTRERLLASLNVGYSFSRKISSNDDVLRSVRLHEENFYLTKSSRISKSSGRSRKYLYAYGIATSGTTGLPKIIKVPYRCIAPNILDLREIFGITKFDKVAQLTSLTFDPSVVEIFLSLRSSATLFMVSDSLKSDANRLLQEIQSNRVTVLQMTPSVIFYTWPAEHLRMTILSDNTYLRILSLGGEPFPKMESVLQLLHPQNQTKIFNIYGITEVSCWASVREISRFESSKCTNDLGKTLSETTFQVRNEKGQVLSAGRGLLYIGSASRICVIDDETMEDLKKPVFRDSGDFVEINETGRILYIGRANRVVKRFGNRLDLAKLEDTVRELNYIKNCYALWDENFRKLHLCVTASERVAQHSEIKIGISGHLKILQNFYQPDKIHILDSLELTPSGKVSVESLKRKYLHEHGDKNIMERGTGVERAEEIFQRIWKESLTFEDRGFRKLGGTSVIALQIVSELSEILDTQFPELIGMLLKDSTYNECLSYVTSKISKDSDTESPEAFVNVYNSEKQVLPQKSSKEENHVEKENQLKTILEAGDKAKSIFTASRCKGNIFGSVLDRKVHVTVTNVAVLKKFDLRKCVDASPTVFQYGESSFATVGSHSGIICTVEQTGDSFASYYIQLADRIEASVLVLDNFNGVVGCYDGHVYRVNLKTGEIIWKFLTGNTVKCTAIISCCKKRIYVGSYDCHVYCLCTEKGVEIWKRKASNGSVSASGCLHPRSGCVLFGCLDGTCVALDETGGKIRWMKKLGNPIFAAPCTLNNGLVVFCSVAGELFCFDIETNVRVWRYKIDGNVFSYLLTRHDSEQDCENIILSSQNKKVYHFVAKGTEVCLRHVFEVHQPIFATPWWEDDYLFIATTDGTLSVYKFPDNKLLRSVKLPGEVFSSPVVWNDLLVVGCRDNNMYILKLSQ